MTLRVLPIAGLLALAIFACVQAAPAAPDQRVVVVVDAAAGRDPAVLQEARAAVARAGSGRPARLSRGRARRRSCWYRAPRPSSSRSPTTSPRSTTRW